MSSSIAIKTPLRLNLSFPLASRTDALAGEVATILQTNTGIQLPAQNFMSVKNTLNINGVSNQLILGTGTTITLSATGLSASRIYNIPDVSTNASFILSSGTQTLNGITSFTNILGANTLNLNNTSNQLVLGTGITITISATGLVANRIYTLPDVSTNASFVLSSGTQTLNGITSFTNLVSVPTINVTNTSNQIILGTGTNTLILNMTGFSGSRTYTIPDTGFNSTFVMNTGPLVTTEISTNMINVNNTSNQVILGTGITITLSATGLVASRIYTLPDVGANSTFILSGGNNLIGASSNVVSQLTITGALPTGGTTSTLNLNTGPAYMVMEGHYAFIGTNGGTTGTSIASTLQIVDVSNQSSPTGLASITLNQTSRGNTPLLVKGKYVYIVYDDSTNIALSIYNISTPTAPSVVVSDFVIVVNTTISANTIEIDGQILYVMTSSVDNTHTSTLYAINVSNPASPSNISNLAISIGKTSEMVVQGKYLYVAFGGNGVNANLVRAFGIYDISNPASITQAFLTSGTTSNVFGNICVQQRYAFLVSSIGNALYIYDISTPTNATLVGTFLGGQVVVNPTANISGSTSVWNKSLSVKGVYLYAVGITFVQIIDISTITSPSIVSSINVGALTLPTALNIYGRWAYLVTALPHNLLTLNLGGSYCQQLEAGSIETNNITAYGDSFVYESLNTYGSSYVGENLLVDGTSAISGTQTVTGVSTFNSNVAINATTNITPTSNQIILGTGTTLLINMTGFSASRIYTLSDVSTNASFILSSGTQTLNGITSFTNTHSTQNINVTNTSNQVILGTGTTLSLNMTGFTGSRIYTLNDASTNASFILSTGTQTLNGITTFTNTLDANTLNLNNTSNQLILGTGTTLLINMTGFTGSRIYTIPEQGTNSTFIMSGGNNLIGPSSNITSQLTVTGISPTGISALGAIGTTPQYCVIQGRYAYITCSEGALTNSTVTYLVILDLSNPIAGAVSLSSTTIALGTVSWGNAPIAVKGEYVYIVYTNSSAPNVILTIYNIYNPAAPSSVGTLNIVSSSANLIPISLVLDGKNLYVGITDATTNAHTSTIYACDVTNPTNPTNISNLAISTAKISEIIIQGKYLYIAFGGNGLLSTEVIQQFGIYDVSNPASITNPFISSAVAGHCFSNICIQQRYVFMVESVAGKLYIYDVSTPTAASLLTSSLTVTAFDAPSNTTHTTFVWNKTLVVQGIYLYMIGATDVQIIDISTIGTPVSLTISTAVEATPKGLNLFGIYGVLISQTNNAALIISLSGSYLQSLTAGNIENGGMITRGDEIVYGSFNNYGSSYISQNLLVNGGITVGANGIQFGNTTTSYIPASLNYYESVLDLSSNWTGPVTVAGHVYLVRIGTDVTLRMQKITGSSGASAPWTFGAVIPSRFLPTTNVAGDLQWSTNIVSGGVSAFGTLVVQTATATIGTIVIYSSAAGGSFAVSGTTTAQQTSVRWIVN